VPKRRVSLIRGTALLPILAALAVILFPTDGRSQNEPGAVVNKLRQALNRIKPFQVRFTQQVFGDEQEISGEESVEPDIEESGEILFSDDSHLKWTYLVPDFKVFLLRGENYRFYDRENEQVTVGKIRDRGRQWIWQLFFSDDILRYTRIEPPGNTIHIRKEDPQEPMNIVIHLNDDYLPVRVIQLDPGTRARMVFYFADYKAKIEIPKDAFDLKVPDDVEIIQE
jgi:outer membrane lipoprotein-sorting protein